MTKDARLTVRMPSELREALAARANRNERSEAAELVSILKRALARERVQPSAR